MSFMVQLHEYHMDYVSVWLYLCVDKGERNMDFAKWKAPDSSNTMHNTLYNEVKT